MGRPSLVSQRKVEILEAFERCIAKHGLDGSSLERIAEEAGMKRSILRHYVGNRDDLVIALAEQVVTRYRQEFIAVLLDISGDNRIEQLLQFFFPATPIETTESVFVLESLIAASEEYPIVGKLLTEYVQELVDATTTQLKREFPSVSKGQCWIVSYGVVGICFNHESLAPLKLPAKFAKAAKSSARALIGTLSSVATS